MKIELHNIIEAILYVAGEPVSISEITRALDTGEADVRLAIDSLQQQYDSQQRGLRLKRFGEYIQLATRAIYAPYIERLLQPVQRQSLSQAALETLAIVAYRQPVTRLDLEAVRGVKCDYSLQSLMNKNLVKELGRKETIGRPILYGTTDIFLSHFGLANLDDLPTQEKFEKDENDENDENTALEVYEDLNMI